MLSRSACCLESAVDLGVHDAALVERVVAPTSLTLPVAAGETLGRVEVLDGDRLVAASDLVAAEAVPDAGLVAKAKWYFTQTARNLWGLVS